RAGRCRRRAGRQRVPFRHRVDSRTQASPARAGHRDEVVMQASDIDIDIDALAWDKQGGMLPAIVQDANTLRVLMLGYMNPEALRATLGSRKVTFYSRSKQR